MSLPHRRPTLRVAVLIRPPSACAAPHASAGPRSADSAPGPGRRRAAARGGGLLLALVCGLALPLRGLPAAAALTQDQSARRDEVDPQRLAAAGIDVVSATTITLCFDGRQPTEAAEWAQAFDQAVVQWCDAFHIDRSQTAGWRLTACVMLDPERFRSSGLFPAELPPFLAGYQQGERIWLFGQEGEYYTRHLLLHEGTHAFMTRFLGGVGAPWYSEGMAELFGLHRWRDGRLELKAAGATREETPYWGRVRLLQDDVAAGRLRTLRDVLEIEASAFREVGSYAWAWAACDFLSRHPRSQTVFAELNGRCGQPPAEFNEWLVAGLADGWNDLERDWTLYLSEIDYACDVAAAATWEIEPQAIRADGAEIYAIDATRGWQLTLFGVEPGDRVALRGSGEFQVAADPEPWPCQAGGVTIEYYRGRPLGRLTAAVFPDGAAGEPRIVDAGESVEWTADVAGRVALRINESPARWRDNRGALTVSIERRR